MDITILVAKLFGIYLVVAGSFLFFKGKSVPHLLRDFFDHPAMMYLTGIILIFLASMYLIPYNVWDGTWRTFVTVFVWLVMLKGLLYVFAPQVLSKMVIRKFRGWFKLYGIIAVVVGVYMFLLG
ncbi:MAG: hypothetical protein ABIF06_01895 [bacterium]